MNYNEDKYYRKWLFLTEFLDLTSENSRYKINSYLFDANFVYSQMCVKYHIMEHPSRSECDMCNVLREVFRRHLLPL